MLVAVGGRAKERMGGESTRRQAKQEHIAKPSGGLYSVTGRLLSLAEIAPIIKIASGNPRLQS